jgi:hypothetical protein
LLVDRRREELRRRCDHRADGRPGDGRRAVTCSREISGEISEESSTEKALDVSSPDPSRAFRVGSVGAVVSDQL